MGTTASDDPFADKPREPVRRMMRRGDLAVADDPVADSRVPLDPSDWNGQDFLWTLRMAVETPYPRWFERLVQGHFERHPLSDERRPGYDPVLAWALGQVLNGPKRPANWAIFDAVLARLGNPADRKGWHLAFERAVQRQDVPLAQRLVPLPHGPGLQVRQDALALSVQRLDTLMVRMLLDRGVMPGTDLLAFAPPVADVPDAQDRRTEVLRRVCTALEQPLREALTNSEVSPGSTIVPGRPRARL